MDIFKEIVKFIRELYKTPTSFIPLHVPVFRGNEKRYLEECIDTTFVSSVGKFVDKFEEEVEKYTGATKAVSCVNGTNALHIALQLIGVELNSEVITQPLTFIATANAISYCGAQQVFIDVDLDTLGLSPKALKKWLEENVEMRKSNVKEEFDIFHNNIKSHPYNKNTNRRISACVPMHTFGHPCRIDEIVEVCNQFNIPVVEDAAESLGSFYKGKHTGTFGIVGVLSYNGNKVLTTGGGGMLLFNDEKLAQKAKHLTTQAKVPHPWEFVHDKIGYNYRMPNINAALGLAQLEQLPTFLESKRKTAEAYKSFFGCHTELVEGSTLALTFITEPSNSQSNYWLNCIILNNRKERDSFLKYTNENGVMTRPAWTLMNKLPMFANAQCDDLINAQIIEDRLVNLPSSVL